MGQYLEADPGLNRGKKRAAHKVTAFVANLATSAYLHRRTLEGAVTKFVKCWSEGNPEK